MAVDLFVAQYAVIHPGLNEFGNHVIAWVLSAVVHHRGQERCQLLACFGCSAGVVPKA